MLLRIVPALVGLLTAVSMFRASGAMEWFSQLFSPALELLGIPADVRKKYMLVLLTVKDEHVSLGRWDTESAINNICALRCV